jgi:hypothetical protein
MESTEGDERSKHDQSKGGFRKSGFDTFHWQEL